MDSLLMEPLTSPAEDVILAREVPVNLLAMRHQLVGHPEYLDMVLWSLDLGWVKPYITNKNPSANMPYHNALHEAAVVVAVYEAAYFHNLDLTSTKALVIAAAFHDFNHIGNSPRAEEVFDAQNIKAAIAGLQLRNQHELIDDIELIKRLIRSTEYPYRNPPYDLLECILRDADTTMPFLNKTYALTLFMGLKRELIANFKLTGSAIDHERFTQGVTNFYSDLIPRSGWGRSLREHGAYTRRIDNLAMLLKATPLFNVAMNQAKE